MTRTLRAGFAVLSSRFLGAALLGAWCFGYGMFAIWSEEAFSRFAVFFQEYKGVEALFWLFLLNFALRTVLTVRRRFPSRPLPTILASVLPLGSIVLLLGFGLSLGHKQASTQLIGEGDLVATPWGSRIGIVTIDPGLKDRILDIEQESTGLFKYEPSMMVSVAGRSTAVKAFPPSRIGGDYLHILQFGIAPEVVLKRGQVLLRREFTPMRLLPPPGHERLDLAPLPFQVHVKLAPGKTYTKGTVTVNEYTLTAPRYHVRVMEGDRLLAEGVADPSLAFADLDLSFPRWTPWVLADIVRDPGLLPTALGLFLVIAGLPLWILSAPWRFTEGPPAGTPEVS